MTARTALPYFFSASQVETFMACPRKWGWKHLARIKPEQAKSAQVGDACHKQLENHLNGGLIDFTLKVHGVRIGDVIAPGLGLLPLPKTPGMKVEGRFEFTSARGYTWVGRKDLETDTGDVFPTLLEDMQDAVEGPVDGPYPVVSDHKSTKSFNYVKEPAALEWDVQANLYAYELAQRRNVPAADLVWTYYRTEGAKEAKRVHLRVTRDHATEAFNRIERIAADMAAHHDQAACEFDQKAYVQSMKPNPAHCTSFGGCPYQNECQLTISERFQASMSNGDFFSNLANVAAAQDAGTPAAAVPAPLQPVTIVTPPASLFGDPTQLPAPPADVIPAAFLPPVASNMPTTLGPPASSVTFGPINPPESLLPPLPTPPVAPVAPVTTAPTEEAPRGRGRPKMTEEEKAAKKAEKAAAKTGAELTQQMVNNVTVTPASVTTNVQRTDDTPAPTKPVNGMGRFDLFIDCIPDGHELTYADDLIGAANERIIEQTRATDKPVAHYKFLSYGQSGGALDIALQQVLDADPPALVFCSSTSDALPTLTRRAGRITRSVR